MDNSAEALALLTLGNDLQELLSSRNNAGRALSGDEINALEFVKVRLTRLPQERPEQSAADGPPRTSMTPTPAPGPANIQWQDEFLNLLVRAASKVKRWLKELDDGPDRPDAAFVAAPGPRRPLDPQAVGDLDSIDPRSDLYRRSSNRLGELLDQSPALRRLWANDDLDAVSRHLPPKVVRGANFRLAAYAAMQSLHADPNSVLNQPAPRATHHMPAHVRPKARASRL